jgi:peptidoglycan/LPS O-acetylase OafA/YrhL
MLKLFANAPSMETRMKTMGPTRGFDYLRIILALGVVVWHSILISYGVDAVVAAREVWWARPLHNAILPMFFALSGFLVTGSLLRTSLLQFVALRALRILPALSVEVTLSAVILGSMFTVLPLGQYFSAPEFRAYFLNIIGEIHYVLPGVFENNPFPNNVNTQLWTIPFELACYLVLIFFAVFRLIKFRWAFLVLFAGGFAAAFVYFTRVHPVTDGHDGPLLVLSFMSGVAVYMMRDRLPFDWRLAAVAAVASWIMLTVHGTIYLSAIPLAYLTAYLGMTHPPKSFLTAGGDYSYGVYLFSVPIQQAIAQFSPLREWWISLALAVPISVAFAALSWKLVEKPALDRKKQVLAAITRFEKWLGSLFNLGRRTPPTPTQHAE